MTRPVESVKPKEENVEGIVRGKSVGFEEAMEMTGFGRFNYFVIFMGGMNLLAMLLEFMGISFVLPLAECDMNLTTKDKGILSCAAFAGQYLNHRVKSATVQFNKS